MTHRYQVSKFGMCSRTSALCPSSLFSKHVMHRVLCVCPCVMTYTHPNHVGSIYPRGMKLPLLIWTGRPKECGSHITLNPQPSAADTKLLCIQLREVCCACQHGLFLLLPVDNLIDLHIDGRREIRWKRMWTGFLWVRMGSSGTVFCMR
jgi:hypothetical protein